MNPIEISRPLMLVFVRHGESEANLVQLLDKAGDSSGYTQEFRNKPNSAMRLTRLGVWQAEAAGVWIRENINEGFFDGYYVSSFKRARHTAGHLHLPQAEENSKIWKIRDYLREQSWGYFDGMPAAERKALYPEIMALKERDGFHWAGLGGESMADLVFRTRSGIISAVYNDLPGKTGIIVSHGNTMWAARQILEGLTIEQYQKLDSGKVPYEKMNNCQIIQYTRQNPEDPEDIQDNFNWMRSVCPWDLSLSRNDWVPIVRPKFSNQDLLADEDPLDMLPGQEAFASQFPMIGNSKPVGLIS